MRRYLEDYIDTVGKDVISDVHNKARRLYGKTLAHVNSTYLGGGVAEVLTALVPLLNDVGIDADWRILRGTPDFFTVTKKFHNALHGEPINFTERKKELYVQTNEDFSVYAHINHDCVIVHDPQPLPLIKFYKKRQPWVWRLHIDLSNPDGETWDFLKKFVVSYDVVIISSEAYRREDLPVEQRVINPAIDPLSQKNVDISEDTVLRYVSKSGVPLDKPFLLQVSRFDKWKDPIGVIEVFKMVKEVIDCRLVLCGNMASDDPEGTEVFEQINAGARQLVENKDLILVGGADNIMVNALQRAATIVMQKSLKEGFGLTVLEALWKGRPVVASNVGGIPLQIADGKNGSLVEPTDNKGFAEKIIQLLKDPDLAGQLGREARESVRERFLVTRLLSEYLDLLNDLL